MSFKRVTSTEQPISGFQRGSSPAYGTTGLRLRLKKRTSINSNFRFHKEKEMADFRRCFYALALVALLAGFTASASAQAFQCTNSTGVPPVVRAEGYAELMGDLVLDCTGGIPTPPNQTVPSVN